MSWYEPACPTTEEIANQRVVCSQERDEIAQRFDRLTLRVVRTSSRIILARDVGFEDEAEDHWLSSSHIYIIVPFHGRERFFPFFFPENRKLKCQGVLWQDTCTMMFN